MALTREQEQFLVKWIDSQKGAGLDTNEARRVSALRGKIATLVVERDKLAAVRAESVAEHDAAIAAKGAEIQVAEAELARVGA